MPRPINRRFESRRFTLTKPSIEPGLGYIPASDRTTMHWPKSTRQKILRSNYFLLGLLLIVLLIVGISAADDFGEAWDEKIDTVYGIDSLRAYVNRAPDWEEYGNLKYYGPAYFMMAEIGLRAMMEVVPQWTRIDARHMVNYMAFLLSVAAVYGLTLAYVPRFGAFGAALLFATQPVLFGHGFINDKDIPFTAFFALTITLGLWGVKKIAKAPGGASESTLQSGNKRRALLLLASSALMLGLATSVRAVGPLAGLLVSALYLSKPGMRRLGGLALYWGLAFLVAVLTWPFLWSSPVSNLFSSLTVLSEYPFNNNVLYLGQLVDSDKLPWHFLPRLLSLQLTIPALLLIVVGAAAAIVRARTRALDRGEVGLLFIWVFLPLVAIALLRVIVYDNFRQVLFITPALFALCGIGLAYLYKRIKRPALGWLILFLAILPGVLSIVRLHPYEYVFYNSIIGGVRGAYRNFELDYWCISYRQAVEYANENFPEATEIGVWGPVHSAEDFSRKDLRLYSAGRTHVPTEPDYGLVCNRTNADIFEFRKAPVVYEVLLDGVPLAVLKDLRVEKQQKPPGETPEAAAADRFLTRGAARDSSLTAHLTR